MARVRLVILSTILLLWAAPAHAVTVAIVQPSGVSPDFTEMLSRLHGELLSVGFEVKMMDRAAARGPGEADPRAWLEAIAAEGGIDAVIEIVGDEDPTALDVWVIEQSPRRLEVSRVVREQNTTHATERLAIRAVEVLRSALLEHDMTAREHEDESSPTLPADRAAEPTGREKRFGVEVGVAALSSLDGVGPALLPIGHLHWTAHPGLALQVELAGLGSRSTVAATVGNARVAQHYGTLGGRYRFGTDQRLWPLVAVSAGALRTSVEGQADAPRQGHTVSQWSFLMDASLGAGLDLPDPYYLTLATHVQIAEPYVAIHFVDQTVATTGRPNLVLTLTVGASL